MPITMRDVGLSNKSPRDRPRPHGVVSQWRIRGGGGGSGSGPPPPLLCHDVGFLTLGPKLDPHLPPPLFACRPNLDPPPFQKSWIRPCIQILFDDRCLHADIPSTLTFYHLYLLCSFWLARNNAAHFALARDPNHRVGCSYGGHRYVWSYYSEHEWVTMSHGVRDARSHTAFTLNLGFINGFTVSILFCCFSGQRIFQ